MKIRVTRISIILLLVMVSSAVQAEMLFRPRASLGYAAYELALTEAGTSLSDSSYPTGGFGATIASDNIYVDLAYNTSLGATHENGSVDDDFKRTDITITVGAGLKYGISIFGGYKTGKTEYSYTTEPNYTRLTFEAKGPFFGASMSFLRDSALSVNVAIALLEGELTDNDTFFPPFDATADSTGFSLGIGYNHSLTKGTGLILKSTFQAYSFKDWVDPNYTISDMDEKIFSTDISYYVNF